MTPAQRLRAAAQLARETAEAATPGPWIATQTYHAEPIIKRAPDAPSDPHHCGFGIVAAPSYGADDYGLANAVHIALWSPPVALAVAAWLEAEVSRVDFGWTLGETPSAHPAALAVADALLSTQPVTP